MLASRPTIHRPLEVLLNHIHKARFFKQPCVAPRICPGHAHLCSRGERRELPVVDVGVLERTVDGAHGKHEVLELEVPARVELVECGLDDQQGVFEAGQKGAAVDEVESLAIVPLVIGVVYLKVAVWRNTMEKLALGKRREWRRTIRVGWD